MRTIRSVLLLFVLVTVGCTTAAGPAASPSTARPAVTPVPSSPAPVVTPAAEFTLDVFPAEQPSANRMAIPGSKYAFLVIVKDAGSSPGPVTIETSASGAKVVDPVSETLLPGVVGEVWVVADPATTETTASLTIKATRGDVTRSVERSIPVFPMKDERASDARPYFERWVAWLDARHPELGISARTTFEPIFVSTLLVVSHYSYWSEDWEMTVAWHNMIPPYDWTEVHLRRRGVDTAPSLAFRIESVKGATEPTPVAPPESVVR